MTKSGEILHDSKMRHYAPPGHTGTVNVRLVEKDFCGAFEMIHGTIDPGSGAHSHAHDIESQVCYVLEGEMEITLDDDAPVKCAPGTIVTIPPKVEHLIVSTGDKPLKLIVIYSPPLRPRDDVEITAAS